MEKLLSLSMVEAHEKIKTGELTPVELVNACLERIEQVDEKVTAWEVIDKEKALKLAEERTIEAKNGHIRGVFHGIPVAIKDIIDVSGLPTQHNCAVFRNTPPKEQDAAIVTKLKQLGAIIVGKAHTAELAYFDPSPTKNPYHLSHTPGGSSSGSAAAVAAQMIPFSVGTQTNASVARPAAYNGVGAYRPTIRKLSLEGVLSFSPSFDSLGFFGKTFKDASLGYATLNETNEWIEPKTHRSLRIGVVVDPLYERATEEVKIVMNRARAVLAQAGHELVEVRPPYPFAAMVDAHQTIMAYEGAQQFKELVFKHEEQLGGKFCELIKNGQKIKESDYNQTCAFMEEVREKMQTFLSSYDLLLAPPADSAAPKDLATTGNPIFTTPWTFIGSPLAVIPVELDDEGLPLAIMFTSSRGADETLIQHCLQIEALFAKIPEPELA